MNFTPALTDVAGFKLALHAAPGLENTIAEDVAVLKAAGVSAVITTLTEAELASFELTALVETVEAAGLEWFHLPVQDKSLPAEAFDGNWQQSQAQIKALLNDGQRLSVHCRGGTGRTGVVAAKIVLACGGDFDATVEAIRAARPGALKSEAQLEYLKSEGNAVADGKL